MANLAGKAMPPMSGAGSKLRPSLGWAQHRAPLPTPQQMAAHGFTLIELLVVLLILAVASGGVGLVLRNTEHNMLEREALRLGHLLEAARAQSQAAGVPLYWRNTAQGFEFVDASGHTPTNDLTPQAPRHWPTTGLQVQVVRPANTQQLQLGPEPLLPAQAIRLRLNGRAVLVHSDGFAPFAVESTDAPTSLNTP